MNKLVFLAFASSIVVAGAVFVDPPVNLQASSPGTKQTGHVNVSGNVLAGTFSATTTAPSGRAVSGSATSPTGFNFGGWFQAAGTDGRGVFGSATSLTGTNFGGYFRTVSTGGRGVVGESLATSGTTFGGYFQSNSSEGRGVQGIAIASSGLNFGGRFQSTSSSGRGVYGEASAANGANFGGYFTSASPSGVGAYARNSNGGVALRAESSGTALQVLGASLFTGSFSVFNNALFGGPTQLEGMTTVTGPITLQQQANFLFDPPFSVVGSSLVANLNADKLDGKDSSAFLESIPVPLDLTGNNNDSILAVSNTNPFGTGINASAVGGNAVVGQTTSGSGVYGIGATGVRGETNSSSGTAIFGFSPFTGGVSYAVYGSSVSGTGFGVYASGNIGASGTKSFRIDHPFDPANKYLFHYSSESPQPQNFYNGNVRTDAKGEAWVTLPDYFEEINKDFKYTLTVVDDTDSADFVQVKVAKKIQGNRFKIRTSAPNVEVSWRVDALRNDKWVQKHPPVTEPAKEGSEKGTYQHPELYGQPAEMGTNYQRTKQAVSPPRSK